MFWNSEFLDTSSSSIDVLLSMQTVKLSDILFEDDLLQELKTSNVNLANFLNRPEIIAELLDNITRLTEKDCCDKTLYSRVHAAYISCEILTGGSSELFAALMNHPDSLNKIISCLTVRYRRRPKVAPSEEKDMKPHEEEKATEEASEKTYDASLSDKLSDGKDSEHDDKKTSDEGDIQSEVQIVNVHNLPKEVEKEDETKEEKGDLDNINNEIKKTDADVNEKNVTDLETDDTQSLSMPSRPETPKPSTTQEHPYITHSKAKLIITPAQKNSRLLRRDEEDEDDYTRDALELTKVVPQKATLVSKLISTIHSLAAANLSCHITQDITSFSKLINLLIQNIDVSGSLEILSTFIKRTTPPELRYVFCEILSKLNFVLNLIDVMTLSDIEDKQRNACQLLCDIIVIGRQEASEQTDSGPMAQDMLAELLESKQAVHLILDQMFSENMKSSTAIVCGMKVLQTLLEPNQTPNDSQAFARTIEQTQEEIEKHIIKFHELLLNPPKLEPIKTTYGIIQKPLGYTRLEVVNLIRAMISTNSPHIIRKLVELKTMKVIIDLFIEYSWNNLLHTQVEQALCLIINNYRHDEELNYHIDMQQHSLLNNHQNYLKPPNEVTNDDTGLQQKTDDIECMIKSEDETKSSGQEREQHEEVLQKQDDHKDQQPQQQSRPEQPATEIPSRALLSQLLNECDLIDRLLLPSSNISNDISTASNNSSSNISSGSSNGSTGSNKNGSSDDINNIILTNKKNNNNENNINHGETNNVDTANKMSTNQRRRNGEQANFGHIIQMINSIAINRDLDTIRDHLNEMKEKRPELYDRWTTFVNVDVASFKEISLYYDAQSATNNVNHRYGNTQHHQISNSQHLLASQNTSQLNSPSDDVNCQNGNGDDQFLAYFSFTRENVLPVINVDVIPRLRRSKNAH